VDEEGWEALLKELKLIEVGVLGACSLFKYGGFPLMRMPPWCHENDMLYESCDDMSKSIYCTDCYPQKTLKTT